MITLNLTLTLLVFGIRLWLRRRGLERYRQ
jgi:hypothetical protein